MGEQVTKHSLKAFLKPPRITNLACLLCSRLVKEQVAEHQFQEISTLQNNHGMGASTVFIHHHHLACLLSLSGKTDRGTPIENLFETSANHQFDLFALLPLSGGTDRGTSIPGGFDPPKQSRNGGLSCFYFKQNSIWDSWSLIMSLPPPMFVCGGGPGRSKHWLLAMAFILIGDLRAKFLGQNVF